MELFNDNIIICDGVKLLNFLPDIGIEKIQEEIIIGLKATHKYISPKFFYNKRGSELFEKITQLKEYYPTRTEKQILSTLFEDIDIDLKELSIIEIGSGDSSKITLLLKQIPAKFLSTINYFPVDISQSAIKKSVKELSYQFGLNSITGIVADFYHQLNMLPKIGKRLFCFLGSTIGNFSTLETEKFMSLLGTEMQTGDSLIMGVDMVKKVNMLEQAYNDQQGITAEFNKNILNAVNDLIKTNFKTEDFEHVAFFNKKESRIEMHLKALSNIEIESNLLTEKLYIKKGETIHTENSHKFTIKQVESISKNANLAIKRIFTDKNKWFSIIHFEK